MVGCLTAGVECGMFSSPPPPPAPQLLGLTDDSYSDYDEFTERLIFLKKRVSWRQQVICEAEPLVQTLLAAARKDPVNTAHMLRGRDGRRPSLAAARHRGKLRCANRGGESECTKIALPLSKFCLQRELSIHGNTCTMCYTMLL